MIDLVDSSEFHQTKTSELLYQSQNIKMKLLQFIKTRFALYLLIWTILLLFSINFQFARIFLCVSGIILIFGNLGKRAPGTLSAYSIFNKNHEKILGTFDSDQVDKQFAGRMNEIPKNNNIAKKNDDMTEEEEEEMFRKIKESYEKNQSKFANQPCYCGSMKKYKKCCYWRELKRKEEEELERKKKK